MFLLGAFLTGGAVGFVADRAVTLSRPERRQEIERSMRDSLDRELQLTDAQRRTVDSVLDWRGSRFKEIMDSVRPTFSVARDSARVLLMREFDPAQQVAFRRIIERNRIADSVRKSEDGRR